MLLSENNNAVQNSNKAMAVVFLLDSSVVLASEWTSVLAEYIAPHANYLGSAYPDHQLRVSFVTYGTSTTRPSPIVCKRWFSKLEQVREHALLEPERIGVGVTDLELEPEGTGMSALEGVVAALEMLDLLKKAGTNKPLADSSSTPSMLYHIFHVAAYPPDSARHPVWNNNPEFDHVSWESLPSNFSQRDIHYSMILLRHIPEFERFYASVCPSEETVTPWFAVRSHHKCLLWSPKEARFDCSHNYMQCPETESIVSTLKAMHRPFSPSEQPHMLQQYFRIQADIDRFYAATQTGNMFEAQILQQQLATEFPAYLELHQYFTSIMAAPPPSPYGSGGTLTPDLWEKGSSICSSPENVFLFQKPEPTDLVIAGPQRGPFGTTLTDYPPRVITQMHSLKTAIPSILGNSPWLGEFSWAGSDPASQDRKLMTIGVLAVNPGSPRDLRSNSWPSQIVLQPSPDQRVLEKEFQSWVKKYDPMWCQILPSSIGNANATLNEIVFRQLVDKLTDQNLYALASWHLPNGGNVRKNIVLFPFGTNAGLLGAVFESVGKPEFPKPQPVPEIVPEPVGVKAQGNVQPLLYEMLLQHHLVAWCQNHMMFEGMRDKLLVQVDSTQVRQESPQVWTHGAPPVASDSMVYEYQDAEMIRRATEEGMLEAATPMLYSF